MLKRIFSIFFAFFIIFTLLATPVSVSAYQVTGFDITAKNGMLISMDTGEILFEKKVDAKVYPASITKIMTAVVILDSGKFDPHGTVTMTEDIETLVTGTGSSVSNIKPGEQFSQLDLLYMVIMSSFGDCTYLAAKLYGGSVEAFVDMMNEKADQLGLEGTNYSNPVGLHEEDNYTTVRDIYKLTTYALKNSTFKEICETTRYKMPATNMHGERNLSTTNFLHDSNTNYYYQYAKGVKTGFTDEAGRCLVSTASYKGYNYMCILMGCPANEKNHFTESANLYRWAFNNFKFKEVATSTEPVCEMPVNLSFDADYVPLYFKEPFVTILPKEADESTIVVNYKLKSDSVDAPVKKGDVLGKAEVIYAEKVVGTVDLVAGNDLSANTLLVIFDMVKSFFTSIYMKVFYIIIGIAVAIFIIICIRLNMSNTKKRKVKYIPYSQEDRRRHEK